MTNVLANVFGDNVIVRPPPPATCNKAGANYKSEVAYLEYSPRQAYDEWLAICDAIVAAGGDAIFDFEERDNILLDRDALHVTADGGLTETPGGTALAQLDDIMTGRVFTANGPWVTVDGAILRALLPNMLEHRRVEKPYYENLLNALADSCGLSLQLDHNDAAWEGMADVCVLGDHVIFTYTVSGNYDQGISPKTSRSSRRGVENAAGFAGLTAEQCTYVELKYPHFHGDTVHFSARNADRERLFHYAGGLFGDGATTVRTAVGEERIIAISQQDAADNYASNSRQIVNSLLTPDVVSQAFLDDAKAFGLDPLKLRLHELFGKAGGGPACATLYLPKNLDIPATHPLRFSNRRDEALERRQRIPELLRVDAQYFAQKRRG